MTLSVIVACKDSFYFITDTMTLDEQKNIYTLNTKKFSCSNKHKIAVCFADAAMVPNPSDSTKPSFSTTSLMDTFFLEVDKQSVGDIKKITSIKDLVDQIDGFIKTKYGNDYLVQFQASVSLFLGIIINGQIFIGSYIKGKTEQFVYSDAAIKTHAFYFSNSPKAVHEAAKSIVNDSKCPITGSSEIEKINILLSEPKQEYRKMVLDTVIPVSKHFVTKDREQDNKPPHIGVYFEYKAIDVSTTKSTQFKIDYTVDSSGSISKTSAQFSPTDFPKYEIPGTEKDYQDWCSSGKLTTYQSSIGGVKPKSPTSPMSTFGSTSTTTTTTTTTTTPTTTTSTSTTPTYP